MLQDVMNLLNDNGEIDMDKIELTPADESYLFLSALRDECSAEEYDKIVTEAATEMELYGLLDTAEIATEAQKNIVRLNKLANFNKVQKRTAIRLAERAGDMLFEKYSKFRKLMIDYRLKIYAKYGTKAKTEARKIIANSRRKGSAVPSVTGKTIVAKMDKQIEKFDKEQK